MTTPNTDLPREELIAKLTEAAAALDRKCHDFDILAGQNEKQGAFLAKVEGKLKTCESALLAAKADGERLDWLDGISVSAVEPEPFRWNIHWGHNEANIREGVDAARADAARKQEGGA